MWEGRKEQQGSATAGKGLIPAYVGRGKNRSVLPTESEARSRKERRLSGEGPDREASRQEVP